VDVRRETAQKLDHKKDEQRAARGKFESAWENKVHNKLKELIEKNSGGKRAYQSATEPDETFFCMEF